MKRAVVLGAYGLIGSACARALRQDGFEVIGVGRSRTAGLRSDPALTWRIVDLAQADASAWASILIGADVVVNAAGALQDGARDRLAAIHETAVAQLVKALSGRRTRLIQISAAGVSETASTEFFRSKARGDAVVVRSQLDWVILRPTLVIAPQAYGGTALLRAAAAFPWIFLRVLPDSPIQTVSVEDLAQAVVRAAGGEVATQSVIDLTEPVTRTLAETVIALRRWQGFSPWRRSLPVPWPVLRLLAISADLLGWLGWRSPLRTTALCVLKEGVTGDPTSWARIGGPPCRTLEETLGHLPSTLQERWFARLYLLFPLLIGTLAVFWTTSGLVGLGQRAAAEAVLTTRGLHPSLATWAVTGGAAVDLGLGLAVLYRPWARVACLGMAAVALAYLIGGTVLAADLWADPLGPFVKVLPAILLSLTTAALLDER